MNTKKKMPVIFTGHGSPMNAIENSRAREGWKKTGLALGKPEIIVAVSAHWATNGLYVRRSNTNKQIFDMYGFPQELYDVYYEPKGSSEYADRILKLLGNSASANDEWGIDHGVWTVLANMYPKADIPVVMISTDISADAKTQFETGRKLSKLRDEGALILASGNVVHNLRMVSWDKNDGYAWADSFDEAIRDAVLKGDFQTPVEYKKLEYADKAVPTAEHYYPLLTALGAASENDKVTVWNEYRELGSMSMTSFLFEKSE